TNPRDDLAGYVAGFWRFDENAGAVAADSSSLANDGFLVGSPHWTEGITGSALDCNGNNEYVVVPDDPSLDATDAITIAAWIKPSKKSTQYVVKKARFSRTDGFELSLSGSSGKWFARFNQDSLGNKYKISSNSPYPKDGATWMHVAVTFDGQHIRLYTNGLLDKKVSAPSLVISKNAIPLGIGAEDDGNKPFDGVVDQVRLHRTALSAQDIADIVNAETLPDLETWSVATLDTTTTTMHTGEKPQAKLWVQNGEWFAVFPNATGSWLHRLDGATWTAILQLSTEIDTQADYVIDEATDVVHILLSDGASTQLASVEYVPGTPGRYAPWSSRPALSPVPLSSSAETATLAMDSLGRLWVAYDTSSTIRVRSADPGDAFATWSSSESVVSGVALDDIGALVAFEGKIGVFWSNQVTHRYGFSYHFDSDDPSVWSADEVPGATAALPLGAGQADDHINLAVTSDGTLYAAVKTSYDTVGVHALALLVRRSDGTWDDLYEIDQLGTGTRPIVMVNEALGQLVVVYTDFAGTGGNILYRTSDTQQIAFSPSQVLMPGIDLDNASSTKQSFLDELVVIGSTSSGWTHQLLGVSIAP
ncbi:MAG: LamG domain-containing protein, partial [Myxococcales bacterium]|nr:LamG domain-containing protein [Myxococcales bacterium]